MTLSRLTKWATILSYTIFFFIAPLLTARAQAKDISHGNQQWFQYYNQLTLSKKWSISSDFGIRFKNEFSSLSQHIMRTGVNFHLDKQVTAGLGFAQLGSYQNRKPQLLEFRPFQELDLKQSTGFFHLHHRFRVEERFFKSTDHAEASTEAFNFRFRYRFIANIPLIKFSGKAPKTLFLHAGDEIFLNAGKEISHNVFDQNRVLLGPAFQFDDRLTATFTYQHQFSSSSSPNHYRQTNVFWFGLKHKIRLDN